MNGRCKWILNRQIFMKFEMDAVRFLKKIFPQYYMLDYSRKKIAIGFVYDIQVRYLDDSTLHTLRENPRNCGSYELQRNG